MVVKEISSRLVASILLTTICIVSLFLGFAVMAGASEDPDTFSVNGIELPERVAGYPVLDVVIPEEDPCVVRPRIVFAIDHPMRGEDGQIPTREASQAMHEILVALKGLGIDDQEVTESFVYGTSADAGRIRDHNRAVAETNSREGCIYLAPAMQTTGRTFVTIQNLSLAFGSGDVIGQGVSFSESTGVGSNQDRFSAFLNNVVTDAGVQNGFIQAGYWYGPFSNQNVWTDRSHGLFAQIFDGVYHDVSHRYWTVTYYDGAFDNKWRICMGDLDDTNNQNCINSDDPGTKVIEQLNTSVFFEVGNLDPDWNVGFPEPQIAHDAEILRDGGNWEDWTSETARLRLCDDSVKDPYLEGVLTGSLSLGATANWWVSDIPEAC